MSPFAITARSSVIDAGSSSQPSKLGSGRTMASSRDAKKPVFPVLDQPGEVTGSRRFRAQLVAAIRTLRSNLWADLRSGA